jgi:hypothetical protein
MKLSSPGIYERQVFINCPFDAEYLPLFRIIVFVVNACGYCVRCALESHDAGEVRLTKILRLIKECQFGIHDISCTALDAENGLPRFNMPLELGLFLGAAHYGSLAQRRKRTLVLDSERYRYQKFISDIAGQDIKAHANDPSKLVHAVRDWLNTLPPQNEPLPGGKMLVRLFSDFMNDTPETIKQLKLHEADLSFADWLWLVRDWLQKATH